MISRILYAFEQALTYVKHHTELQFAFVLILVLPLALLYTGNEFLEAGRTNQDKLQRDRVGMLHDSFVSVLRVSEFDPMVVQAEIDAVTALNPDITKFRVIKQSDGLFVPIAAIHAEKIGVPEAAIDVYQAAAVRFDESLIFPFSENNVRYWQAVRSIRDNDTTYFILTENSFAQVDAYIHSREQAAYVTLILMYLVLLGIAYWLIRLTNYQALYADAQKAIKTKDLFTNMIAHELRAPLTAMRGYAEMIKGEAKGNEKATEYANRVMMSSERLLAIVNDLLDVARIQSGKMKVELSEVNITDTVVAVTEELQPSALEKDIRLTAIGIGGQHYAYVDQKRLHQALTNLVSNAIKYTKEGAIEISLEDKALTIELRVKDTGMGISAEDQQKLFAPFFRVESTDVSAITGSGLGMWITRQLIELMGATIGVESIKNVGTHVVVQLPKKKQK